MTDSYHLLFTDARDGGGMSPDRLKRSNPTRLHQGHLPKRRREVRGLAGPAVVLGAAAIIGGVVGTLPSSALSGLRPQYEGSVIGCSVTDGDTIRCGDERIRLLGIDAPELPGHCRAGRHCAAGDGYASKASLAAAMVGTIHISRVGEDHYGRTLAMLSSDVGDLSCWQLQRGQATYKPEWDDGFRIARICPKSALL